MLIKLPLRSLKRYPTFGSLETSLSSSSSSMNTCVSIDKDHCSIFCYLPNLLNTDQISYLLNNRDNTAVSINFNGHVNCVTADLVISCYIHSEASCTFVLI